MKWNIAPECISLVILGIIWIYSRKGSHLPTLKNKIFQGCLTVTFSAMLTNILSTYMLYHYQIFPLWLTFAITTLYYILTPLMGLVYFLYTVSIIYMESSQLKRIIGIGIFPGAAYTVLVFLNLLTRDLFDIKPDGSYIRGRLISATYIIFYLYCLASIVITAVNRRKMDRKIFRILGAFPILAVAVIVVQQFYPNIILSGSAATCAMLIIYLHFQNKQISMDYLTNVPNRQELLNMISLMIKSPLQKEFTLIVVSIRDFRQVNNSCGNQIGDLFLKSVCQYLCQIGPRENVYRFSGDEFALLFNSGMDQQIKQCILAVEERMTQPWQAGDYQILLSAAIGIIRHANQTETLEQTINAMEYAIYQAKSGKYGQVCYCDEAMLAQLARKEKIIQILKQKLEDQSFEMYYQPIYSIKKGAFCNAESLMRIPDSEIGPIYPSEFIPIAEETGLITDITYVILDKVCKFSKKLMSLGVSLDSIHVNFSGAQFSQRDLEDKVLTIIHSSHIPPSSIKIEFTESTLAESTKVVTKFAHKMEQQGIKMGLDDFGTGFSNIATVINIPFGTIKLDRSLICASISNKTSALVVKNLVRTFKDLGMKVIAEGVETEEQKKFMFHCQVDQIQGYYYSKPLTESDMIAFMRDHPINP